MDMEDRVTKNSDGRNWIDALPEHVAWVVVAANCRPCQGTQPQHRLGAIHHKPRMHLDCNLHSVLRSERSVLYPVWCDHLIPLPFQNIAIVGWPGTSDPVRRRGQRRISGTTGKIHHNRDAQFFCQQNRLAAHLTGLLCPLRVRMQCITVTTESTDGRTVVCQPALELTECGAILEQ